MQIRKWRSIEAFSSPLNWKICFLSCLLCLGFSVRVPAWILAGECLYPFGSAGGNTNERPPLCGSVLGWRDWFVPSPRVCQPCLAPRLCIAAQTQASDTDASLQSHWYWDQIFCTALSSTCAFIWICLFGLMRRRWGYSWACEYLQTWLPCPEDSSCLLRKPLVLLWFNLKRRKSRFSKKNMHFLCFSADPALKCSLAELQKS